MKTFDKSSKLDHVAYDIRGPVLDEANRMMEMRSWSQCLTILFGQPASV